MNLRAGVRDTNSGAFSPRAIFFWPVLARVTLPQSALAGSENCRQSICHNHMPTGPNFGVSSKKSGISIMARDRPLTM
jgi:hypothetical protein